MTSPIPIRHPNAKEFISGLRRSNDAWWSADASSSPWVFRGVGNADEWKLLPAAWRLDEGNKLEPLYMQIRQCKFELPCDENADDFSRRYFERRAAEKEALFQFAVLANESGFSVPAFAYARDRSPLGMNSLETLAETLAENLREKDTAGNIDLMALAQHHGIPTRFLDWSVNPMAAAFFAASPSFRPETSQSICVWALNRDDVQRSNEEGNDQRKLRVVVHEPPRGNNRYLHAQGGIFTEVKNVKKFVFEHGRWPSLEDVHSAEAVTWRALICHQLTSTEVPCLLRLLAREGMNFAALMPSLDKIAETVVARWNYADDPLPSGGGR